MDRRPSDLLAEAPSWCWPDAFSLLPNPDLFLSHSLSTVVTAHCRIDLGAAAYLEKSSKFIGQRIGSSPSFTLLR